MMRFTEAQIRRAREGNDLLALIERDGIKLIRRGREAIGICPFHSERTPSFTVPLDKGFYHCFGCGAHGDAIKWRQEIHGESFVEAVAALINEAPAIDAADRQAPRAAAPDAAPSQNYRALARALWHEARALAGTPGEGYFRARGIAIPLPPTLRYHAGLSHGRGAERRVLPGVVAAVQDLAGQIVAVHRIFLDPATIHSSAPRKTALKPDKALLGPPLRGAIRLAPAEGPRLGLTEGIETGLAVRQAMPDLPIWAAISASRLPSVDLPPAIVEPIELADRDEVCWKPGALYGQRPGEYWARLAALEHKKQGRRPRIASPARWKADFNDLIVA